MLASEGVGCVWDAKSSHDGSRRPTASEIIIKSPSDPLLLQCLPPANDLSYLSSEDAPATQREEKGKGGKPRRIQIGIWDSCAGTALQDHGLCLRDPRSCLRLSINGSPSAQRERRQGRRGSRGLLLLQILWCLCLSLLCILKIGCHNDPHILSLCIKRHTKGEASASDPSSESRESDARQLLLLMR